MSDEIRNAAVDRIVRDAMAGYNPAFSVHFSYEDLEELVQRAVESGVDWARDPAHEEAIERRGYARGIREGQDASVRHLRDMYEVKIKEREHQVRVGERAVMAERAAEQRGYERGKAEECDRWRAVLACELGIAGEPLGINPAGGADIAMHVELQLQWAREEEREACAGLADVHPGSGMYRCCCGSCSQDIAVAIRARGKETDG